MPDGKLDRQFADLLDAHGSVLMSMLRRLCRNAHDAEDVFQETAARVWRNLPRRPLLSNPRGWLMTIGYRAFVDSRSPRRIEDAITEPADCRAASPPVEAEKNEADERVQAAIAVLPELSRDVVILHYLGGFSLRQTAAAMNISTGTAKSRLNAALNRLRSMLE